MYFSVVKLDIADDTAYCQWAAEGYPKNDDLADTESRLMRVVKPGSMECVKANTG